MVVLGRGTDRRPVFLPVALFALTLLSYLAYAPYDQWWYLRFLLPGPGPLFALAAAGVQAIDGRIARPWGLTLCPAARCTRLAISGIRVRARHVRAVPGERAQLRDVGAFVARETSPNAVFFALQHSGTIRFYGGRHTLRYDQLDW